MILIGKMGSGKSTVANIMDVQQFAFADLLKEVITETENTTASHGLHIISSQFEEERFTDQSRVYSLLKEIHRVKPTKQGKQYARWYYQQLGQLMREIDPLFWVKAVRNKMKHQKYRWDKLDYVITDCRFKNEFKAFKEDYSIYLECDDTERIKRLKERDGDVTLEYMKDISEIELESLKNRCDYIIDTTGLTMDELQQEVWEVMVDIEQNQEE